MKASKQDKIHGLAELKQVRNILREQREARIQQSKLEQEHKARQKVQQNLFRSAIGKVVPLPAQNRVQPNVPKATPIPVQLQLDEARVLQESISDDFDVSNLLETDEALSYSQPGISAEITSKLRRGHWSIKATLDLHGLRLDDAREAVGHFIRTNHRNGVRCVRIIHGKGHGSPGKVPVLKSRVHRWLVQKIEVLAFVQAKASDGGTGAVVVLLDRHIRTSFRPD